MKRSTKRILTTHVGSLPRSDEVVDAVGLAEAGEPVDAAGFERTIASAVAAVVHRQVETGIDVVNDGEQGKFSFTSYHRHRLTGFSLKAPEARRPISGEAKDFPSYFARWPHLASSSGRPRAVCTGPVTYENVAAVEQDVARLKAAAVDGGATELFLTAISPATLARITPNEHYARLDKLEEVLAEAMRVEYELIAAAGIVLQIDCPDFGVTARYSGKTPAEHRVQVARNVELQLDHATRNIDPDAVRLHVCWGADEAPHHRDVPLADMLDILLTARPNGMTIVGANGRHEWEWQVWRDVTVPDGKVIVPGVIDSTTNIIEHPETVAERIVRYASVLGRENVIAGVDCGLDTVAGVRQVDPEIAWAKLASLVEDARLASKRLWH